MTLSGFTFCRNMVRYDYPVVESIMSILPIVDEFVVNVGRCEDGTLDLIRSIDSPKIRIVESVWDETLRKDGIIYSEQTNIALSHCTGAWAFYLQADEVIHEQDLPRILEAVTLNDGNPEVRGLLFRYLHFVGDYWSLNPWFYHKAVRIIRNDGKVESCGDAVGFQLKATRQYLQSGPAQWLASSGARVFHYGWVKDPKTMLAKKQEQTKVYHGDAPPASEAKLYEDNAFDFDDYSILKEYRGSHPAVMHSRLEAPRYRRARRNRWLNWRFYREVARRGFRG
jgi:hypothetical protein